MTTHTPQEMLKRYGIDYVSTKSGKFTTQCPNCGQGYLNVVIHKDKVAWFCHHCDDGASAFLEQREKSADSLGPIRAVYDYCDETGKLLFQSLRYEPPGQPKKFKQRTGPDQEKWSIKGVRIVPYRLPELLADLAADHVVFIVEGEKDVNSLRTHNVPATCNPMGAGKWWPEFNHYFRGADVVLVPDNDQPGREHAQLVISNLQGVAGRIRMLDLAAFWPDMEASADISDWLQSHDVDLLWRIVGDLPDYKAPSGNGHADEAKPQSAGIPVIMSHAQFLEGFVPPDYLIEGMLQRRFIYALTGQTGHAKTAVALLLARLVSCADKNAVLKRHRVEKGRVLYFVGENPDDVRMRVMGADALRDDNPELDDIWFIPGVFNIDGMTHVLSENFKRQGEVSLIIIDTSAAYFLGNEELSNTQMGNYARMLRKLTTLPGGPCVLVLCHPIKHVTEPDQLLPRGGGAYLAEMDGNLTLWRKTDDMVELNYNKMRGPGFQPIAFKLETIRHKSLCDNKGRMLPTVQAIAIDDAEEDQRADKAESDEDRVLAAVLAQPTNSLAGWAKQLEWISETGDPYKVKVVRILERLAKQTPRLTQRVRGNRWKLTEDGKDVARKAAIRFRDEVADASQETMF
jgi:AAA domain-containing protein